MSGVVEDVTAFLTTMGLAGGSSGWDLIRRKDMDKHTTDRLVVVLEDGGVAPEISAAHGLGDSALADPGVLLIVRAEPSASDEAAQKAADIIAVLHAQIHVTIGSTLYYRIRARTPEAIFAGFDERGRPRHTIGFQLLRDVAPPMSI